MRLFKYQDCLVVANNKDEALIKIKQKLHWVYLEDLTIWEIEEINEVDGYSITVIM